MRVLYIQFFYEWIQALIIVPCRRFQVSPHQAPSRRPVLTVLTMMILGASEAACKTRWLFQYSRFSPDPWGNDPM